MGPGKERGGIMLLISFVGYKTNKRLTKPDSLQHYVKNCCNGDHKWEFVDRMR